MNYESPDEFRQALEAELVRAAKEPSQVELLRSEIAFERALSRFDYGKWLLKGGYAMRLILPVSRATQDLDLVLWQPSLKELEPQTRAIQIQQAVERELSRDAGDHFHFEVRQAIPIRDLKPENLAAIVLINAEIGGEEYCKIRIDVGAACQICSACPGELLQEAFITKKCTTRVVFCQNVSY